MLMKYSTLILLLLACSPAVMRAQCEGTQVVIHTFTSFSNSEITWDVFSAESEVVGHYDWAGNGQHSYDTLCLNQPCAFIQAHSFTGEGWGFGTVVEVLVDDEVIQSIEFNDGELGYFPIEIMDNGCDWQLGGCLDMAAVNYTPGATVETMSCDYIYSFDWNGTEREYLLHVPFDLPAGSPLLFCLHGLSGNMEDMRLTTEFNELADEHGFVACWPQGSLWNWDGSIVPYWNSNLFLTPADDIGFLTELALSLQLEYELDPVCTFVCGASNGGMMSYTLIAERPDVWRGMATAGGVMSAHEQQNAPAGPPRPVLHLHGTSDDAMPYDAYAGGGPWAGGWGVMDMMEFWANEHGHTAVDSVLLPDAFPDDGLTNEIFEWTGGLGRVVHHRVYGGVHEWWGGYGEPNEVATSEIVWEFFDDLCANPMQVMEPYDAGAFSESSLVAYPNPAQAGASVQLLYDGLRFSGRSFAQFDSFGRCVWRGKTSDGRIPTSHLLPGVYSIHALDFGSARGFSKLHSTLLLVE